MLNASTYFHADTTGATSNVVNVTRTRPSSDDAATIVECVEIEVYLPPREPNRYSRAAGRMWQEKRARAAEERRHWRIVGEFLLSASYACFNKREYNSWLRGSDFSGMPENQREDAMWLATHWDVVAKQFFRHAFAGAGSATEVRRIWATLQAG
jgi:hypothetical protein